MDEALLELQIQKIQELLITTGRIVDEWGESQDQLSFPEAFSDAQAHLARSLHHVLIAGGLEKFTDDCAVTNGIIQPHTSLVPNRVRFVTPQHIQATSPSDDSATIIDGCIYVIEQGQSVNRAILQEIETLLSITRTFFFFRLVDEDEYTLAQTEQSNQDIDTLRQHFGDLFPTVSVYPVDTVCMRMILGDEWDEESISLHSKETLNALKTFLLRVAGFEYALGAIQALEQYHQQIDRWLRSRHEQLLQLPLATRAIQKIEQQQRIYQEEWGSTGQYRQELTQYFTQKLRIAQRGFEQALREDGEIGRQQHNRINEILSIEEAQNLAQTLAKDTVTATIRQWMQIDQQLRDILQTELERYGLKKLELLSRATIEQQDEAVAMIIAQLEDAVDSRTVWNWTNNTGTLSTIKLASREGFFPPTTYMISGLIHPIAPILTLVIQLGSGLGSARQLQLGEARQELVKYLSRIQGDIRRTLTETRMDTLEESILDEYFKTKWHNVLNQYLDSINEQYAAVLSNEAHLLEGREKFEQQQRTALTHHSQQLIQIWSQLGSSIRSVLKELQRSEQQLYIDPSTL